MPVKRAMQAFFIDFFEYWTKTVRHITALIPDLIRYPSSISQHRQINDAAPASAAAWIAGQARNNCFLQFPSGSRSPHRFIQTRCWLTPNAAPLRIIM